MKHKRSLPEHELIEQCKKNNRKAQRQLYERFGPKMKFVCRRYLTDKNNTEDVLNQGFLKVFNKLNSFQTEGSFEGWIKRIIINTCLDQNRKDKEFLASLDHIPESLQPVSIDYSGLNMDYILQAINALPLGYKTVFNLVEVDGYNHKEVGNMLQITESASRSQLAKAKQALRKKLSNG